ncbi:MAG: hypothetical protein ACYTXY_42605, partial [Nostoc sp.]
PLGYRGFLIFIHLELGNWVCRLINVPNSNLIKPFKVLSHCNTSNPDRKSSLGFFCFYISERLY